MGEGFEGLGVLEKLWVLRNDGVVWAAMVKAAIGSSNDCETSFSKGVEASIMYVRFKAASNKVRHTNKYYIIWQGRFSVKGILRSSSCRCCAPTKYRQIFSSSINPRGRNLDGLIPFSCMAVRRIFSPSITPRGRNLDDDQLTNNSPKLLQPTNR
ncbi:hypothetical protein RND71_014429 [Anisodus tanguticus]|uniref:Uncharacterized protein n=1 Tax=Anisodus tanguticus TaxID=243964 RepID=A0AAE1VMR1_9SOLA|nr:hypothetical protein RND71_014429 [Anisodus tanguticus]